MRSMKENMNVQEFIEHLRTKSDEIDDMVAQEVTSLWEYGIDRISDDSIRGAVQFFYAHIVPIEFFVDPASTTGKHPIWHNARAGILRHLTECCAKAPRAIQGEDVDFVYKDEQGEEQVLPRVLDIVLAASLLTDGFKNGVPWGPKSVRNHGEIAAFYWRLTATGRVDEETAEQIANAVHYHYGRYTWVPEGHPPVKLKDLPTLTQIVHRLDLCSSDCNNSLIYLPVKRIPSLRKAAQRF